jgi:hypothetical protein
MSLGVQGAEAVSPDGVVGGVDIAVAVEVAGETGGNADDSGCPYEYGDN